MIKADSNVLSVTQLTQAIKAQLEPNFTSLSVKGEITNLRKQASGHYYFSLKDENAQVSAVLFKGNARFAAHLPKIGDQVLYMKGDIESLRLGVALSMGARIHEVFLAFFDLIFGLGQLAR